MHTWQWQPWHDRAYLTCDLLQNWHHGFFTRQFHPHTPDDLSLAWPPVTQSFRVKQVHGNLVLATSEMQQADHYGLTIDPQTALPKADGLFTEDAHQAVWACSADCTPVLIGDQQTGQVAAIHSGWRGTAQKIVPNAIQRLLDRGSQVGDLCVALGPAISGDVYQVSHDVAAEVGATVVYLDYPDETESSTDQFKAILSALAALPKSPILPDPHPDRVRLDVRQVIALQLEQFGLAPEQVAIAPHCTHQQPDQFFSYRRDGQRQVQWSGIVSR